MTTVVDQLQGQEPHEGLADRVEVDQRVGPPLTCASLVGPAPDQIDDDMAIDDHADSATDLATLGEVAGEGVGH